MNLPASRGETGRGVIELDRVSRLFTTRGGRRTAVEGVSASVDEGEFLAIVGPSGCGKSTLLAMMAGLLPASAGDIHVLSQPVRGVNRSVGLIFQRDALLPWRTALQNVSLPLRFRGVARKQAEKVARDWLLRVGLKGHEKSYPHQLSGGMRKRVAIAATLVFEPKVLLMDEPFSALDVQTRNLMENDLLELWQIHRQTVVFVTHDIEEAIGLSDRVLVMTASPGRILGNYPVPLRRPRDLTADRFRPELVTLYHRIWDDVRSEVVRAYRTDVGEVLASPAHDAGQKSDGVDGADKSETKEEASVEKRL
jgi:NitT/TauT family transport system ATP-binding protein